MTHASAPTIREVPPIRDDAVAVTVAQFCKAAGIGKTMFYSEVRENRIRTKKIGSKTLIPVSELSAWLERLPSVGKESVP